MATTKEMMKNKDYDLISVIYNASQAAEVCKQYLQDAESEGDRDAAKFFNEVLEQNVNMVCKGRDLLKTRLQ